MAGSSEPAIFISRHYLGSDYQLVAEAQRRRELLVVGAPAPFPPVAASSDEDWRRPECLKCHSAGAEPHPDAAC